MRYLHDGYEAYRAQMGPLCGRCLRRLRGVCGDQTWRLAARVDSFIANSRYVAARIERAYGRASEVIPPPIDLALARTVTTPGNSYLCAGRLVGYKRTELMVEACARLGRRLHVAGAGPEQAKLRALAGGDGLSGRADG